MSEGKRSSTPSSLPPKRSKSPWRVREELKQSRGQLPPSNGGGVGTARRFRPAHRSLNDVDVLKLSPSSDDGGDGHDDDGGQDALLSGVPSMFRASATSAFNSSMRRRSYTARPPLGLIRRSREGEPSRDIDSTTRRSSVFDSMGKYLDDESTLTGDHSIAGGGDSTSGINGVDDDEISLSSLATSRTEKSLGSIPPVRRQNLFSGDQEGRINPSLNLSMDLSKYTKNIFEEDDGDAAAISAASDELWARFKLLGRLGLGEIEVPDENKPLIDKNVNILERALRHIVSLRDADDDRDRPTLNDRGLEIDLRTGNVLEEVLASIEMPTAVSKFKRDPDTVSIAPEVSEQLRDYVTVIMTMYRNNSFHNFEHASHVLKGINKLISYVVTPDDIDFADMRYGCGVATEPWTQFALVFSALIHDVDHTGVPNATLVKEKSHVAGAYKNKSVAEQNSIELAWNLLMEPCYKQLRECLFLDTSEIIRFRGMVVSAVMATDIADKELAALRKGRAAEALSAPENAAEPDSQMVRRKATFVLETLIQAADVSHTMQSFQAFKKWNRKLFDEMYLAFKRGRADHNPIDSWFKGEFGFFDYYVIPLARKLKECGVFGKACEEYVKHAMTNRREWELHGESIVEGYRRDISNPAPRRARRRTEEASSAAMDSSSSSSSSKENPRVDGKKSNDISDCDSSESSNSGNSTLVVRPLPTSAASPVVEEEKKEERMPTKTSMKTRVETGQKAIKKKIPSKASGKAGISATDGCEKPGVKLKSEGAKLVRSNSDRSNSESGYAEKKTGVRRVIKRSKSNDLKQRDDKGTDDRKIKGVKSEEKKILSKSGDRSKGVKESKGDEKSKEDIEKDIRKVQKLKRQKSLPKGLECEEPGTGRERPTTNEPSPRPRAKSLDSSSEHARQAESSKTATSESAAPMELKKARRIIKRVKKVKPSAEKADAPEKAMGR
jgi:hypothetical protein